jgi:hypothetical protein
MVSKTFNIFASKAPPKATRDALDVAARYFIYKLYDATRRQPMQWVSLKGIGEASATIARAVELGWVVLQPRGGQHAAGTQGRANRRRAAPGAQGEINGKPGRGVALDHISDCNLGPSFTVRVADQTSATMSRMVVDLDVRIWRLACSDRG